MKARAAVVAAAALALAALVGGPACGYASISSWCTDLGRSRGLPVVANRWWAKSGGCVLELADGTHRSFDPGIGEKLSILAGVLGIWVVGWLVAVLVLRFDRRAG